MCFFLSSSLLAQDYELTGKVLDESNLPLIGANVTVKGTVNGTMTNPDGLFRLTVPKNAVLEVSYVGYITQFVKTENRKSIQIILKENTQMLDETIVIGYGSIKKSDLTGAVASVNINELQSRPTSNPAEALQGAVAGVLVQKASGEVGASVQVKIRGIKTAGNNNPLYIIDGFQGDIENVNPADIASMEILKDGAAAAIYGSRAANGVIIVNTKNGNKGETKVDFSSYFKFTHAANKLDLLNAEQYRSVHRQMYENAGEPLKDYITKSSTVDTDWQNEMLRSGFSQNYMVSMRGGNDNARYSLSYNREDASGIFLGNDLIQDNARAKLNMKKYIFDVDANMAIRVTQTEVPQYQLKEVYMISPLVPVYDENQKYGFGLTNFDDLPNNNNPMADHKSRIYDKDNYDMNANVAITMNFTSWLNFKTSYSYRGTYGLERFHSAPYESNPKQSHKYAVNTEKADYWQEQVFDNVLTFNKEISRHSLNVMAGSSITTEAYRWIKAGIEGKTLEYSVNENGDLVTTEKPAGFPDNSFITINAGSGGTPSASGSLYKYHRASFFGRVNYAWANRYLAQFSIRYDGSSKFGSDSRWGLFPSVALGWRITEEPFFPENSVVSNLKLRASWGRLGNEVALGYYDSYALIESGDWLGLGSVQGGNPWPGSIAQGLENRSLKWETTDNINIGVDYGFFNNKLSGSMNYYINQTNDLLIYRTLPPSAGLLNPTLNVGKIRNSGFELEVNYSDNINDFNYNVGLNLSTLKNKVVSLANKDQTINGYGVSYGTAHFANQTRKGMPVGAFYLYRTDGIFQSAEEVKQWNEQHGTLVDGKWVGIQPKAEAGDIRFRDLNGDGQLNEKDKEECGFGLPKVEANLSASASYKGFDLSFLLGGGWGHKLYNANRFFYEGMSSGSNFMTSTLNAWSESNPSNSVPRAVLGDPNGNTRESDRFLEKGDFIRLRQLQAGYSLPKNLLKKAYIENLRIYVSGENLFTITDYSGIDPEFASGIFNSGLDLHVFPFTRSFVAGIQLTF
ncbi:MAG: TonB-dependent receptor [Bacteroidales bacterium]